MKKLWKYIPPCLSDVQGFQLVINETEGVGIVDDPSRYKNVPRAGEAGRGGFGGGRPMEFGGTKPMEFRGGRHEGFGGGRGGFEGHGGFGGRAPGRVFQSDLRNSDIISGTEAKILEAFENNGKSFNPDFVLLCNAPSSAMISSDLESAALKISSSAQIPAGTVKIYGEKDYLYGISMTLEAMGKLLLSPSERIPRTVNILGCNTIDWPADALSDLCSSLEGIGMSVLSKWGAAGMKTADLKKAAQAAVNLVVNISGLRLARYMESEFGIPYISGAPFGEENLTKILNELSGNEAFESLAISDADLPCNAIVIGEQFTANAIRSILRTKGFAARVLSFYETDKAYMQTGDKKLSGEDDLKEAINAEGICLVIADPDYRMAVPEIEGRSVKWIDMPNSGMSVVNPVLPINMTGAKLDSWLSSNL